MEATLASVKRLILILLSIAAAIAVVLVVGFLLLRPLLEGGPRADFDAPAILAVDLDGLVVERSPPDLLSAQFEGASLELHDLALALDRAASDDRIAGVYLNVGLPGYGWAKAEEIRARLADFQESGKLVHAFMGPTNELGYYVALAADSVFLLRDGIMELNGFRAETPFIRGTLEKLGLDPQVEAIGVYKSAADMFRRDAMTDENREVTRGILDEHYGRFVDAVVEARGVDPEAFRAAFAEDDRSGVIDLVRTSGAVEAAQTEADRLLAEAREALTEVPAGQARDALEALTHYVVERRV